MYIKFTLSLIFMLCTFGLSACQSTQNQVAHAPEVHNNLNELDLEQAAYAGDVKAQLSLGELYLQKIEDSLKAKVDTLDSTTIAEKRIEAFNWLYKAAQKGNPNAQYKLGLLYYDGNGVAQDYEWARYYLYQAAIQNHASAMYNLAFMYAHGLGGPKNSSLAFNWYLKAAKLGDVYAQYDVAKMYAAGIEVRRDYFKAIEWFTKAAEQNDAYSLERLGDIYENARGVRGDRKKALMYYTKACQLGLNEGCVGQERVQKLLHSMR